MSLRASPGRQSRKCLHPGLRLLWHCGCPHSPVRCGTAGRVKRFLTDGGCWDFVTSISAFKLSYQVAGFCIVNSVTGSIYLNACSVSVVALRAIQENNSGKFRHGVVGNAVKWARLHISSSTSDKPKPLTSPELRFLHLQSESATGPTASRTAWKARPDLAFSRAW